MSHTREHTHISVFLLLWISIIVGSCTIGKTGPQFHEQSGPDSSYYSGRVLESEGRLEEALGVYTIALTRDENETRALESGLRVLRILIDEGKPRGALRIAKGLIDRFNRDTGILRLYAEACLETCRNRKALWAANEVWDAHPGAEELLLLTEASRRTGLPIWRDRLLDLCLSYPVSTVHRNAFENLPVWLRDDWEDKELLLVRGKALVAGGKADEGLDILREYIGGGCEVSPLLVQEAGSLFRDEDKVEEGINFFSNMLRSYSITYSRDIRAVMHEEIGSFLFVSGRRNEAVEYLRTVMEDGEPLSDTAAEMLLKAVRGTDNAEVSVDTAVMLLPGMKDPEMLSDLLEEILSSLVRERNWGKIVAIEDALNRFGPPRIAAMCAYLSGRILQEGYTGRETESEPVDFFKTAVRLDSRGYYGFLSRYRLSAETAGLVSDALDPDMVGGNPVDDIVTGFFTAKLPEEGIAEAYERMSRISTQGVVAIAEAAAGSGHYLDALRVMLRWNEHQDSIPTEEALRMLYPRWFEREITAAASEHRVPENIFFALVREESAFQPDIVSRAGAVGLSQLMPSTADYSADLMSLEGFDIRNPADNTTIGSWYLARLRSSLPSYGHALAAYNAGPGRTAGWIRLFQGVPADMFVEAIPITETRRYVKRVLVSSAYYGYLYYNMAPTESVRLYYF